MSYAGFLIFYTISSLIISTTFIVGQILAGEMGQAAYGFDTDALFRFIFFLAAIMAIRAVFSALEALFSERFFGITAYNFRTNFAKFFLRQPFSQFEKTNSGESLSIFTNDLPESVEYIRMGMMRLIADFSLIIIAVIYMLYLNWLYTLIFFVGVPVIIVLQMLMSKPIEGASRRANEARASYNAVVNDSLQNVSTIITYNLENKLEERYMTEYRRYVRLSLRRLLLSCIFSRGGEIFSVAPVVFLFIASGISVINNTLLLSEFIVFTGIAIFIIMFLASFAELVGELRTLKAGAQRLLASTTGEEEVLGDTKALTISGQTAVEFNEITFAYNADAPDALSSVSFSIPIGAKVAIIGGSGSGKSTILKLLLGLYEPKSGKISVLDNDISGLGKRTLRDAFAYVPQDSFMFPKSIAENITNKKVLSKDEQAGLEKACNDAGILDFINSLPRKFESVLSESAENISGGQRQRIAMARAFYKDAPIILFDEATSALDPTTEAEILETLKVATINKTVIMVAHRKAAMAFCDTVISLEGGRLA